MEEHTTKKKSKITMSFLTEKIFILVILIAVFGSGYLYGEQSAIKKPQSSYNVTNLDENNKTDIDFSLFWEAWNRLEQSYVDKEKLDPQQMYYGAIKGMVASIGDAYTYFLTPEELAESKRDLEGKFFGIGAELGLKNNAIVIVTPLKNSPAETAGVRPGDIIVEVDGKSTVGWTIFDAVNNIRGDKGTTVILTMIRAGESEKLDIPVVRDEINIPFVELSYEGSTAVVELSRFGDPTNDLWDEIAVDIADKYKKGEVKGIVLDVRGNPGGYLQSAIHIASDFVAKDTLIVKQEYATQEPQLYRSMRDGRLRDVPIVVLQNSGSASASEIVAGALRDTIDAKVVGENSFGKGTVQTAEDLQGGAGIHITISKWILPGGDWINEKGIKPDVEVKNDIKDGFTLTRETDKELDTAIAVLNGTFVSEKTDTPTQ